MFSNNSGCQSHKPRMYCNRFGVFLLPTSCRHRRGRRLLRGQAPEEGHGRAASIPRTLLQKSRRVGHDKKDREGIWEGILGTSLWAQPPGFAMPRDTNERSTESNSLSSELNGNRSTETHLKSCFELHSKTNWRCIAVLFWEVLLRCSMDLPPLLECWIRLKSKMSRATHKRTSSKTNYCMCGKYCLVNLSGSHLCNSIAFLWKFIPLRAEYVILLGHAQDTENYICQNYFGSGTDQQKKYVISIKVIPPTLFWCQ